MSAQQLFIFQIGPVQSFIAAARRTQDLYVGSKMLSTLAKSGVEAAMRAEGFQAVFPVPNGGKLPQGVPHRFAFIATDDPAAVAESVQAAISQTWQTQFVDRVHAWLKRQVGGGPWETVYERQTASWLEFNWVAVPYDPDNHTASYQNAARAMAARRSTREFQQVEEDGVKCTLTGAGTALPKTLWDALRGKVGEIMVRPNEALAAMATIKRFAGKYHADCGLDVESFPSTDEIAGVLPEDQRGGKEVSGYLAVLHMDGDSMGKRIAKCQDLTEHQEFSRTLAHFADEVVPEIIAKHERAVLIYAGGDDVLALLPLSAALKVADELQAAFHQLTGNMTASAGIAVTPFNLPLDVALQTSRDAEKKAKDGHGRAAVVVTEVHGGQMREAGTKWTTQHAAIVDVMDQLYQHFIRRELSSKLGYDLQDLTYALGTTPAMADARAAELSRLLHRRLGEGVSRDVAERIETDLHRKLVALGEDNDCGWDSLANWVILARFLASEGKRT